MLDRTAPQSLQAPHGRQSPYYPQGYDGFDWHYGHGLESQVQDRLDLRGLIAAILRHRMTIVAIIVAGLCLGLLSWLATAPVYQATARLEILAPAARVVRDLEAVSETPDLRSFQTAIERLKSRGVILHAVRALALTDHRDWAVPGRSLLSRLTDRLVGRGPDRGRQSLGSDGLEEAAVDRIRSNLTVALIRNTSVLTVTYRDADPERAKAIADQVAASYIDERRRETGEASGLARRFVEDQVAEVKRTLARSETDLVAYARAEGITETGGDGSLLAQNIKAVNTGLAQAMGERLAAESLIEQIDAGVGDKLAAVLENGAGLTIRSRIVELRAQYQQNLRLYKPDYPDMRMLRAQIGEYETQLADLNASVIGSIRQRHAEIVSREREIGAQLADLQSRHAAYAQRLIHYTILQREVDSHRAQYDALIARLNEIGVGAELQAPGASVLDPARTPGAPIAPSLPRNLLVSVVLAAALAACVVYILERLNTAFRTPEQVEGALKLSVLSALPAAAEGEIDARLSDARSPLSEAYRSLRTSLQFAGAGGTPRMLLVTSAEPDEGKTTTAAKIAQDFALIGQRVLLVDADMRRPSIHRRLKLSNRRGLSDVLSRRVSRKGFEALFQIVAPNLMVLTAGPVAPNPVDLLSASRTGGLFDALQRRYDLIVVDAPPVLGLSDAPLLSRIADATLLVVSARQVDRRAAALALANLRAAGANVLGAAMTKVRASDFDAAYAYTYPQRAEPAKASAPRRPRKAIEWDYYGDPHVPRAGLLELCRRAYRHVLGWTLGRRRGTHRMRA